MDKVRIVLMQSSSIEQGDAPLFLSASLLMAVFRVVLIARRDLAGSAAAPPRCRERCSVRRDLDPPCFLHGAENV
jgi:hypothetical protein